jgi:DNA-binding MarR family transcriptional regulator
VNTPSKRTELPSPSPSSAELVDALRHASRGLQSYLVAQARASGLGLIEYLVLVRAADGDGVIARDAARAFGLGTSTMTGLTDRLERDKLVRRHAHPDDRRLLLIKATGRGRQTVENTTGPLIEQLQQMAGTLSVEERQLLVGSFEEITDLIAQHADKPHLRSGRRSAARSRPRQQPAAKLGQAGSPAYVRAEPQRASAGERAAIR